MSLDITILDAKGYPQREVSIGLADHHRLMQIVADCGALLFTRMRDYYEDAKFEYSELDRLLVEISVLSKRCKKDTQLVSYLNDVAELAQQAKLEQRPLTVIAD